MCKETKIVDLNKLIEEKLCYVRDTKLSLGTEKTLLVIIIFFAYDLCFLKIHTNKRNKKINVSWFENFIVIMKEKINKEMYENKIKGTTK